MKPENTEKKILNKFEIFLLILGLAILIIVILQNMGINMIETTEKVEISEAERKAMEQEKQTEKANTLYKKEAEQR